MTINGGEGFWVNANQAFNADLPIGAAISSSSFKNLTNGWNLIATGDSPSPSTFNAALGSTATNFTSLWSWDTAAKKWHFYSPALDSTGNQTDYINSRGYETFGPTTLSETTGFWVNK